MILYDHPAWEALRVGLANAITQNLPEWIIGIGAFFIAAICMMPEKCPFILGPIDTPQKERIQVWWTWLRSTLQTMIPAARSQHGASLQVATTVTPDSSTKTVTATDADPNGHPK